MDTELLRTFLEVKNTRHFGKAAENLYLTQAAVSARIKQLENRLGAPLFTRFRNNLQLTVTGERLVNHAETILLAWDRAKQDVALKKKQKHIISLGATSGLWDLLFRDTLHEIHRCFPELAIRAASHSADTLIRQLMERTVDLCLIYEPAKLSDLVSNPIAPSELILVSSFKNATLETTMYEGYISVDWGLGFQMNYTQLFPDAPPPLLHTTLARIALDFITEFGGSAYLPYRMVEKEIGNSLFQVPEAPVISRQIYACHHRESQHYKDIEAILELIRSLKVPVEFIPKSIEI